MKDLKLPKFQSSQQYYISPEGLQKLFQRPIDTKYPNRNVVWADDFKYELPVKMGKSDTSSFTPVTLIDEFKRIIRENGNQPALSEKRDGKWVTINFQEYYGECMKFAKALIAYKINESTAINIIGFNSPEWFFTFYGSLFSRCLPVGIYTTNNVAACEYIALHSEAKVIIAENRELAEKYYGLLKTGKVDLIVIYRDNSYVIESQFEGKVIHWSKFIKEGDRVDTMFVEQRMQKVKPGHCCTLVYTSGTTGMPKGVMLSHDNYVWTKKALNDFHKRDPNERLSCVSYLPLSHVAAQFTDIVGAMLEGMHVYFAEPTALQGTLIQTLQEVRPKLFMSVPRVWEKIYDKMMEIAKSNGFIKTKIATWAKSIGKEETIKEIQEQPTSWQFKLAKVLVYNNVKKALGLDQCKYFFFGAAPLDPTIRAYFLSLNFYLINTYGMSESTGPQNFTDRDTIDLSKPQGMRQVGRKLPGTEIKIVKQNENDQDGEICYRGRNVFMGYYKNPEETAKTIDAQGFLHSGDNGKITENGVLFITGRAKELIITAGGQNIPPILIENEIKAELPCVANVMAIGDMKKFLTCLVSLREQPPFSGNLDKLTQEYLANKGAGEVKTVKEAQQSAKVRKVILDGLKRANEKAISRAQHVQDFYLMPEDFSVQNGLLTPTMKLKRKEVLKKYEVEIQKMYATQAKL